MTVWFVGKSRVADLALVCAGFLILAQYQELFDSIVPPGEFFSLISLSLFYFVEQGKPVRDPGNYEYTKLGKRGGD